MRNNINESLNLLKELEVRLKTQQQDKESASRIKTQTNKTPVKNLKPWGQRCIDAYQQNQKQLKIQNQQLKRYVNRLIKMNDYLKNQLVKEDIFQKKQHKKNINDQKDTKILRVQVEYLKELNKQKQLQIQFLKQNQNKKKKKSIFTQLKEQISSNKIDTVRRHKRQVSSKSTIIKKCDIGSCSLRPSNSRPKNKCSLCYS